MKKKYIILLPLMFVLFFTCNMENPIMEKWWKEQESIEPARPETEYIPIIKMIPQMTYEVIIDHEIVYETIIEKLPPEVIYETITEYEVIYETVFEKLPPEIIYDVIIEYINEDIWEFLKEQGSEKIIEFIKELDPDTSKAIIKEIIKEIPPNEIMDYLTDEQIKYIIKVQPPEKILQNIMIINVEFIIFAQDSVEYNGDAPKGSTSLTGSEKNTNDSNIAAFAKILAEKKDYLVILHGHANPDSNNPAEIAELQRLSEERAKAVENVLKDKFYSLFGKNIEEERISSSGYSGEKNFFGSLASYTGLNRRVEMILLKIN